MVTELLTLPGGRRGTPAVSPLAHLSAAIDLERSVTAKLIEKECFVILRP